MDFEFDQEIVDGFIREAREYLTPLGDDLCLLEQQGDHPDTQLVQKVARPLHTIKVAAGFLDLDKICELSRTMEAMVTLVRNGDLVPGSWLIRLLLEGVDGLHHLLENIEHHTDTDISPLVNRLQDFLSQQLSVEVKQYLEQMVPLTFKGGSDAGFAISEYTRKQVQNRKDFLYVLKFDLDEIRKTRGKSPVLLIKELLEKGEILDGKIDTPLQDLSQQVDNSPLFYEVLYRSPLSKMHLEIQLDLTFNQVMVVLDQQTSQYHLDQPGEKSRASAKKEKPMELENETLSVSTAIINHLGSLVHELVQIRNLELQRLDTSDTVAVTITQRLDTVTSQLQKTISQIPIKDKTGGESKK
ncbi:MAG: Hpt domain-containing protein [Candidatus Aminicenantes bacterium]|nr:MAG: Hpt domain-containing protein [Candidatus Aminicenantes bacterium]